MVDMKCEGCVNAVKNKLETIQGTIREKTLVYVLYGHDLLWCCLTCVMKKFDLKRD